MSKKLALLIGILYRNTNSALEGCINDTNMIGEILSKKGYKCTYLTDDTELKPTKSNIIYSISTIIDSCENGDSIVIHYSGHGSSIVDSNKDETDGKDEVICPLDYNKSGMITDDLLHDLMVKKLKDGVKLRVIFDCCHSGSGIDLPFRYDSTKKFITENSSSLQKDIIMISGCKDDQTSADAYINGGKKGALTWGIVESLSICSWKDLIEKTRKKMKERNFTQIPQLSVCNKDDINKMIDF